MSTIEQHELKTAVKEAIKEMFLENSAMLKELIVETLEEIAMFQRLEEGRQTEMASRESIMELLESRN